MVGIIGRRRNPSTLEMSKTNRAVTRELAPVFFLWAQLRLMNTGDLVNQPVQVEGQQQSVCPGLSRDGGTTELDEVEIAPFIEATS